MNTVCLPSGMLINLDNVTYIEAVDKGLTLHFTGGDDLPLDEIQDAQAVLQIFRLKNIDINSLLKKAGIPIS